MDITRRMLMSKKRKHGIYLMTPHASPHRHQLPITAPHICYFTNSLNNKVLYIYIIYSFITFYSSLNHKVLYRLFIYLLITFYSSLNHKVLYILFIYLLITFYSSLGCIISGFFFSSLTKNSNDKLNPIPRIVIMSQ